MRSVVLYVLGAPGIGKTTLVREILERYSDECVLTVPPAPKWTLCQDAVAAGHYTGSTFDGGDTVPYSGARAALDYWAEHLSDAKLTILDGARFSSGPSLARIRQLAPNHAIIGVHLVGDVLAAARREQRGTDQNASWVKGATTGARNFAKKLDATDIQAGCDTPVIADAVLSIVDRAAVWEVA